MASKRPPGKKNKKTSLCRGAPGAAHFSNEKGHRHHAGMSKNKSSGRRGSSKRGRASGRNPAISALSPADSARGEPIPYLEGMRKKNVPPGCGSTGSDAHKLSNHMAKLTKPKQSITPSGGEPPGLPERLIQLWRKLLACIVEDVVKPILSLPGVEGPGGTKVSLGVFVVIGVCLLIWRLKA